MSERRITRRFCVTPHDRQVLAGAYWPVIVYAAVLGTARIAGWHRHRQQAAVE
jgi:hypothetical protein